MAVLSAPDDGAVRSEHGDFGFGAAEIDADAIAHARLHSVTTRLAQPERAVEIGEMTEIVLDVKGMRCPLPVLRANRALRGLPGGSRLRVLATDRASVGDFQAFCRETGHALLAQGEEGGVFSFTIRKRPDPAEVP